MEEFSFHGTEDVLKIRQVYALESGSWGKQLSGSEYEEVYAAKHLKSVENGDKPKAYYLEDSKSGEIVAGTVVRQIRGYFKEVDKSNAISSVPDPDAVGVKNVTILHIGYVYMADKVRNVGISGKLISKVIEDVEESIIQHHIDTSSDSNDSFKNMVVSDGYVDRRLAHYYLGKKYVWMIYSTIGGYYEKFGFKSYPIDVFKIPTSFDSGSQDSLVRDLLTHSSSSDPRSIGKKLNLLHGSKSQDRDTISYILQGKELEILTDLNKQMFHSDLAGSHRSSTSLTNVNNVLSFSKMGSSNALSSITELTSLQNEQPTRRRNSSIHEFNLPKFSVKPEFNDLHITYQLEDSLVEKKGSPDAKEASDIKGAILTNDLQKKSHYVLWATLRDKFFILGLGEMKFDVSGLGDPTGMSSGRRGSSFTGLNELGGFNFQDLDLLISTACYFAKKRQLSTSDSVYVAVNDLPTEIPLPVLHDYFLNYLPKSFENVSDQNDESAPESSKVKLINNAAADLNLLPALKLFGQKSPNFDLDWTASGLWSYV